MNLKTYSIIGAVIISLIGIGFLMYEQPDSSTEQPKVTRYIANKEGHNLVEVNISSLFKVYG